MQAATSSVPRIVVVGGNGYLGSAICKAAIAKGWEVDSISSSGTPSLTPAGHARRWTTSPRMRWHKASAFEPSTYAHLLGPAPSSSSLSSPVAPASPDEARSSAAPSTAPTAVVHALGILLEADYKRFVRAGDVFGLARAVMGGGEEGNPLAKGSGAGKGKGKERMTYDRMNRESAMTVLQTLRSSLGGAVPSFSSTDTDTAAAQRTPFVYISAEDVFPPPLVPRGYVDSKRAAEREIADIVQRDVGVDGEGSAVGGRIRPVFVRPGLMYHPHIRPLSTPLAALLDITANIHTRMSALFPSSSPSPSPFTSTTPATSGASLRTTLSTPPIHVDHVALAVLRAIEDPGVEGVVRTRTMRAWAGWDEEAGEGVYDEGQRQGEGRGDVVV